jgi:hypothetical protein
LFGHPLDDESVTPDLAREAVGQPCNLSFATAISRARHPLVQRRKPSDPHALLR